MLSSWKPRGALAGVLLAMAAATAAADSGATAGAAGSDSGSDTGSTAKSDSTEKPRWFQRWLDPSTAPFIPVPEVDVDPVGGVTTGVIPVFLKVDENDEIRQIIAPDIIHSQYFGWGARGRIFSYPSSDSQWSVVGGGKQQVEREFDALYVEGLSRSDRWSWSVHTNFDRSGTPRFYGVGNSTTTSNVTNYVDNQGHLEANLGWNFSRRWSAHYLVRMGFVQIEAAVLPSLPSIQTLFPKLPGLDREEELQHRAVVAFDTRDSITIPRKGELIQVFAGVSSSEIWGTVDYSFFGADVSVYRPIAPWLVVAMHGALRYMPEYSQAPFWALSSIGGDLAVTGERQPLRSFGQDRFVDRNSFASSIEFRTRVAQMKAFATNLSLEVTPLFDVGRVFSRMGDSPVNHLHAGTGVGIRAVASPFIVGYLDVGWGSEGPAVFTGINYPF